MVEINIKIGFGALHGPLNAAGLSVSHDRE